jgi:integrase
VGGWWVEETTMPRQFGRLTALTVKAATARGLYPDGQGLCLQIARDGSRSWIFRFRFGGRRRYAGLGTVRDVSLQQARERARAARQQLDSGVDPIEAKRGKRTAAQLTAAKAMSFAEAARSYVDARRVGWTQKTAGSIAAAIDTYANPILGSLPVGAVDTDLVLKVLEPVWSVKSETASRLRQYLEAVLDFAKVRGYRSGENPAAWRGHLDHILPTKAKVAPVQHLPALDYREIGAFMARLRGLQTIDARALEFTVLVAARSGEVLGARWEEVDLAAKIWMVPAIRTKARRDHRIPLSGAVVALLKNLPEPHVGPLFPGRGDRPINRNRLLEVLRQLNPGVSVHGFRSVFRDWAGDCTTYSRETIEAALSHVVGDRTETSYRRGDALQKRRALMESWATYCAAPPALTGEVVELRRPA